MATSPSFKRFVAVCRNDGACTANAILFFSRQRKGKVVRISRTHIPDTDFAVARALLFEPCTDCHLILKNARAFFCHLAHGRSCSCHTKGFEAQPSSSEDVRKTLASIQAKVQAGAHGVDSLFVRTQPNDST